METVFRLAVLGYVVLIMQACSVIQATSGPESKDLSVLEKGTHRYKVLAELGQPIVNEKDADGTNVDVFKFYQGTHGGAKVGRALGYGLLAVGTLGLSELITSPVEGELGKGAEIQLKVGYNADDRIDEVVVLQDDRWIPIQKLEQKRKIKSDINEVVDIKVDE